MKKFKHLFLGVISLVSTTVFAQTTTTEKPADPLVIKYQLSSDFTGTFGNTESFLTVNQGILSLYKSFLETKFTARYRYGVLRDNSIGSIDTFKVNNNEFYFDVMMKLFPKNRVYGFVTGGFEFSFLRGVNYRAWGGAGAGFKVLTSDDHKFEPTIGVNYELTGYQTPIVYRNDTVNTVSTMVANAGWTGTHKFFKGKLVLTHDYKFILDVFATDNWRFDGGFGIAVPVVKNLNIKAALRGSYMNIVPTPKRNADMAITLGVSWGNL